MADTKTTGTPQTDYRSKRVYGRGIGERQRKLRRMQETVDRMERAGYETGPDREVQGRAGTVATGGRSTETRTKTGTEAGARERGTGSVWGMLRNRYRQLRSGVQTKQKLQAKRGAKYINTMRELKE